MGINVFAHYLFIQRLLPLMEQTAKDAPPNSVRLVFQSSEMHRLAPSDDKFKTLAEVDEPDRDPARLYGRTKLAMVLLGKEIVKRKLSPDNKVLVLSVHPGTVDTGTSISIASVPNPTVAPRLNILTTTRSPRSLGTSLRHVRPGNE